MPKFCRPNASGMEDHALGLWNSAKGFLNLFWDLEEKFKAINYNSAEPLGAMIQELTSDPRGFRNVKSAV